MNNRNKALIWTAAYLLISLLFAGRLLCPEYALYRWDTMLYTYPICLEQQALVRAGHLPLWASSFACGTPLLGNINAASLYPLRLIHWLLPMPFGYHLFLFAHVWLTFLGMHVFIRKGLRLSHAAAMVGALCFGASGYARAMWDTHNFLALPWIPLGFAAVMTLGSPGARVRGFILAALAWTLLILSGDTQAAAIWVPAAAILLLTQPEKRKRLLLFGCVLAAGLLVTAPQWWAAMATHAQSYRAGGLAFAEAVERSFHPVRLLELVVPHLFGSHEQWFAPALLGEGATRTTPWTASFHVGLFALLLVFLSMRQRRKRTWQWSAGLALVSLLLSFGRYLPGFPLWQELPILGGFRYPEKYLLWSTMGLAVMAAWGWSIFAEQLRDQRKLLRTLFTWDLLGAATIALSSLVSAGLASDPAYAQWKRIALYASAACIAAGLLCLLRVQPEWKTRLAVAAVLVSLLAPWYLERPLTSSFDPFEQPPIARVIRESPDPQGRFLYDNAALLVPFPRYWPELKSPGERDAVYQWSALKFNAARNWGLRTADGFSPLESKAMRDFRLANARPADGSFPTVKKLAMFCRFTGVRWLYTTPARAEMLQAHGLSVHETARWENGDQAGVLVYLGELTEFTLNTEDGSEQAVSRFTRPYPGRIEVALTPGDAAQLTISETFDKRWRAVDQSNTRLNTLATSGLFLAVELPEGTTGILLTFNAP